MDLDALIKAKAPKLPSGVSDADVEKALKKFAAEFGKTQTAAKAFKGEYDKGVAAGNDLYTAVEGAAKKASGNARTDLMKFVQEVLTFKRANLT